MLVTLSSSNSQNQESYLFNIWQVFSPTDVRIKTRIPLFGTAVEEVYLDDHFAVVVLIALEPPHPCRVYVVSIQTQRVVQTLDYDLLSGQHNWASYYLNGLMIDYHPAAVNLAESGSRSRNRRRFGKGIRLVFKLYLQMLNDFGNAIFLCRVVDVATGLCLSTIPYGRGELEHLRYTHFDFIWIWVTDKCSSIRLNYKYMIGLQVNPVMNIYDRLAAVCPIDETESKKKGLVHLASLQVSRGTNFINSAVGNKL